MALIDNCYSIYLASNRLNSANKNSIFGWKNTHSLPDSRNETKTGDQQKREKSRAFCCNWCTRGKYKKAIFREWFCADTFFFVERIKSRQRIDLCAKCTKQNAFIIASSKTDRTSYFSQKYAGHIVRNIVKCVCRVFFFFVCVLFQFSVVCVCVCALFFFLPISIEKI